LYEVAGLLSATTVHVKGGLSPQEKLSQASGPVQLTISVGLGRRQHLPAAASLLSLVLQWPCSVESRAALLWSSFETRQEGKTAARKLKLPLARDSNARKLMGAETRCLVPRIYRNFIPGPSPWPQAWVRLRGCYLRWRGVVGWSRCGACEIFLAGGINFVSSIGFWSFHRLRWIFRNDASSISPYSLQFRNQIKGGLTFRQQSKISSSWIQKGKISSRDERFGRGWPGGDVIRREGTAAVLYRGWQVVWALSLLPQELSPWSLMRCWAFGVCYL